ncbi:MlaD family protein [Nocardia arizonensis]|uniref:MlaD family protein n=1 Tax=Nocardia arizonensis TaxID=1141647 RepID=UPI0006D03391|nr:MlaD family protein [Nocardia arizonensis]
MTGRTRGHLTRTVAAAVAAAAVCTATGCAVTVDNVPLPKPGIGGDGYVLHVAFRDALNLPDRAHVKIGGTDIGVVTDIDTTNFIADVEMSIRTDIQLPRGTTAELRQATPLGDIFVAMTLPAPDPNAPLLRDGDTIGTELTSAGASVEQLMMSISMLLNGGGLNQAARITAEMNSMFGGRAPQLAHLLTELTSAIEALNNRTADIDSTLSGISVLTGELARRKAELGQAADTFPALLGLVAENNRDLSSLIGKVAVTMAALQDFTDTTGGDTVGLFDSIQKLMSGFAEAREFGEALERFDKLYPSLMAGFDGPALAFVANISFLSVGALTDPTGSRLPEIGDVPAFIGSLAQVLEKVFGRLTSPPQQPGGGR